ncbi:MAG: putative methyltransferase FkbM [Segetibacter sp.]|nr:putative methyltransferase FkbM [Segetibacter sp.]
MISLSSQSIFSEMFAPALKFIEQVKLSFKVSRNKGISDSFNYIQKHVAKKQTVLSIGIGHDQHLFLLRKIAGKFGKVIVFATGGEIFSHFLELVDKIKWSNVVIEPIGTSETPGEIIFNSFTTSPNEAKGATVIDINSRNAYNKKELNSPTLDSYCLVQQVLPDFVEIKMPGFELKILEGATGLLKNKKPILVIECEERLIGRSKVLEVFQFLTDLKYKGYFILDTIRIPLQNFDFDVYQNPRSNFYCNTFIFE